MMEGIRTALLTLVVVTGCTTSSGNLGRTLPDCGFRGPTALPDTELFEHPVIRESGHFVGITTERYDRPGADKEPGPHYQSYSLLDCRSGAISKIEGDAQMDRLTGKTLLERIAELRAEQRLTRTGQLQRLSRERGWTLLEGRVDPQNGRARCACDLLVR